MRILKFVSGIVGSVLILLSGLGVLSATLAFIDPAGAKAADDTDPFGVPPTSFDSIGMFVAYVAVGLLGTYLLWVFGRQRRTSS